MSDQLEQPFFPRLGGANSTASRTVSGSSASVAVPLAVGCNQVRVLLTGATAVAFIRFVPTAGATAVTTDMPITNGVPEVFTVPPNLVNNGTLYLAAIGTDGTIYITPGDGA